MAILDLTKHSGTTIIKIPDFDSVETVEIEVRRPSIARMIQNDSISNDLMKLAIETATDTGIPSRTFRVSFTWYLNWQRKSLYSCFLHR